jgi:hypothetical protein
MACSKYRTAFILFELAWLAATRSWKFFESNILIKIDLSLVLKPYVFSRLQIEKACVEDSCQVFTNVKIATFVEPMSSSYSYLLVSTGPRRIGRGSRISED